MALGLIDMFGIFGNARTNSTSLFMCFSFDLQLNPSVSTVFTPVKMERSVTFTVCKNVVIAHGDVEKRTRT